MLNQDQPARWRAVIEPFFAAGWTRPPLADGAYAAIGVLTLVWGGNWIVMKLALENADPVTFNLQRTWLAVVVLFAVLIARGGAFWPSSWIAVIVTGLFQTTLNFGSTTMALAGGAAGRTSVLVSRCRSGCCLRGRCERARRGRNGWRGPRLRRTRAARRAWTARRAGAAALGGGIGLRLGGRHRRPKYYQRDRGFDMLNFIAWQMLVGVLPLTVLPLMLPLRARSGASRRCLLVQVGVVSTAAGSCCGSRRCASARRHGVAQHVRHSVIALLSSMAVFGERLTRSNGRLAASRGARHRHRARDPRTRAATRRCPIPRPPTAADRASPCAARGGPPRAR